MALIWHDNLASQALFRRHGFGAWGAMPGIVWADARSRDMLILGRTLVA
jgi:L-amino acid N-acyltransferase YncA